MRQEIRDAEDRLLSILRPMEQAVVAYSGGVDSALLATAARRVLGDRAVAITILSPTFPDREVEEASGIAAKSGIRHEIVRLNELDDPTFAANPADRCYHCKKRRIGLLEALARERGISWILDGSNLDDLGDDRPGYRAVQESGMTRCPLIEARMTKAMIRELSLEWGIPGDSRPAAACLASRIPYGVPLTADLLRRVERAEETLRALLPPESRIRVRTAGSEGRIEVDPGLFPSILDETTRRAILDGLRLAGYSHVTLDLAGYRRGGA